MPNRVHTALANRAPDYVLKQRRDIQITEDVYYKGMETRQARETVPLWTKSKAEAKRMRGAGLNSIRTNLSARGYPTVEELA